MGLFDHDKDEKRFEKRVIELLEDIDSKLTGGTVITQGFAISDLSGGNMQITAGGSGTFQYGLVPVGSLGLQAGSVATFSVDDPAVSLSASPDSDATKVVASVPATDTGASFNLTVSGTNTAGAAISSVFNITIVPAAGVVTTGFSLSQLA